MEVVNERIGRFGFLERIGGALIDPEITFNAIIKRGIGVGGAALTIIIFSILEAVLLASTATVILTRISAFLSEWFGFGLLSSSWLLWMLAPALIILNLILSLLAWVILGGITHLTAKYAFAGEGSYSEILTLYGYGWSARMPLLAGIIISILARNMFFLPFFAVISLAWMLIVWTAAVRVSHGIDFGRAFVSVFIMPLVVFALIGFGAFLALGGLMG